MLKRVIIIVTISLVGLLVAEPYFEHHLAIEKVNIEGNISELSRQKIVSLISPQIKENLWKINTDTIRDTLLKEPWLRDAKISKRWPNTLTVYLTEKKALAKFNQKGLLDERGDLFSPDEIKKPPVLTIIGNKDNTKQLLQRAQKMGKILNSQRFSLLAYQQQMATITLTLSSGLQLVMNDKRAEQQLVDFLKIYPQLVKHKGQAPKRVDLRYRYGLAVRWEQDRSN